MGVLRTSRPLVAGLLGLTFAISACTSGDAAPTTQLTVDLNIVTTETSEAPDVEPDPPVVLGHQASLSLGPGQCFSDLTIDQPRRDPTSPESAWVDLVDCNGTHFGAVYAVGCLGISPEAVGLVAVACPGSLDDQWPGKVELQRAAVRSCLPQFEAVYGETYAETELRAVELLPTEEIWLTGERRVVCAIRGD